MEFSHVSVLLNESIEALRIKPDGIYADGTLGGGGHSLKIAEKLDTGRLLAIDRDSDALKAAKKRLSGYESKITFIKDNYRNLKHILSENHVEGLDGIILDLGVSSYQLDEASRGFSYNHDAPLDMRMDRDAEFTALDVVNGYSAGKLEWVIKTYGEERWAKRIVEFIVQRRPLHTTGELVEAIKAAIPKAARKEGGHPAKRTFQAIRIEVNGELEKLEQAIGEMAQCLAPGGRFAIITFHSLEDRAVKNAFRHAEDPCSCPREFPVCVCGKKPFGKVITKKPILPGEAELVGNPRSQSAKLRVLEKI
ncbi:MAG: 16S rRNA (cytosine(1402)-N(4))-methyltransferase RsmH [Firmicutes bacterium]|nr:16S rRNA (cytosine(1402)-N(4))-methyltransferase RsmH [Bacillota bacterium]